MQDYEQRLRKILEKYGNASSYEDAGLVSCNNSYLKFRTALFRPDQFLLEYLLYDSDGQTKGHCGIQFIGGIPQFFRTKWCPTEELEHAFYSATAFTFGHSLFVWDLLFQSGNWCLAHKKFLVQEVNDNIWTIENCEPANSVSLSLDMGKEIILEIGVNLNLGSYDSSSLQATVAPTLGNEGAAEFEKYLKANRNNLYTTRTQFQEVHFNRITSPAGFTQAIENFTIGINNQ